VVKAGHIMNAVLELYDDVITVVHYIVVMLIINKSSCTNTVNIV